MGHLRMIRLTNQDPRFYPLLGPFLSKRQIVKELGAPVWDDDEKTWVVAMSGTRLAGFAAHRRIADAKHVLCSAYVLPEFRKAGVYQSLLTERLKLIPSGETVSATATQASRKTLQRAGFAVLRTKGRYFLMEKSQ